MRRYLKISLLLLILNSLFLLNVHALENDALDESLESVPQVEQVIEDNQNEPPQVENSLSIDDLIGLIPNQLDLNYTQEDAICLFDDNYGLKVISDLVNQIQNIFNDNNISLDELGVDFTVQKLFYQEGTNYTIFQYQVTMNGFGEVRTKIISTTYSNDNDYNLDDEELVNNSFDENEVLETNSSYDFYTGDTVQEVSVFDAIEEKLPDVNYTFYFEQTSQEDNDLSVVQNGHTYLFINKVFYRILPTILRFYYQMNVSPEITNQDIVHEVSEKLEELQVEIPNNDVTVSDQGAVYSNDDQTYHGTVEIKKLKKEEKENYPVTDGDNTTIVGSGQLSIKVNCLMKKLIRVLVDGNELDKSKYSIQNNAIIISSNYISGLSKGNHSLVVRFSDGDSNTSFTLKEEERVEPQQEYYRPYYPVYTYVNNEEVVNEVKEVKEEIKKEENEEEKRSVLSPSDVVKNRDANEDKVEKKEEDSSRFNMNYIPIIIVIFAFIFGAFGGYLYKKSLED